jgi:hypothetical protein
MNNNEFYEGKEVNEIIHRHSFAVCDWLSKVDLNLLTDTPLSFLDLLGRIRP